MIVRRWRASRSYEAVASRSVRVLAGLCPPAAALVIVPLAT